MKNGFGKLALMLLALTLHVPASAQMFSDSYTFLKAVKDRDGGKVTEMVDQPGSVIVNTRENGTGRTALHYVVERRDDVWLGFLLQKGANPQIADRRGETPLHLATQLSYLEGIKILLAGGAKVDPVNTSGETPLIRAVQLRDVAAVRLLLAHGANPDRKDSVAGRSAREYAQQDNRAGEIFGMIEAGKKPADAKGLDFSGPLFK